MPLLSSSQPTPVKQPLTVSAESIDWNSIFFKYSHAQKKKIQLANGEQNYQINEHTVLEI